MQPAKIEPSAEVAQVVKWILSGATSFDIAEAITTTYPNTQPMPLMLAAMKHFENAANFDPAIVRGWCFEANRDLYRRMVDAGDYPNALRAIKQIQEMTKHVQYRNDSAAGREEEVGTPAEVGPGHKGPAQP